MPAKKIITFEEYKAICGECSNEKCLQVFYDSKHKTLIKCTAKNCPAWGKLEDYKKGDCKNV